MRQMSVGLFLLAGPVAAGPIAVTFSGVVTEVLDTTSGRSTAGMGVGSAFTATVIYDPESTPVGGGSAPDYRFGPWSMTVGERTFTPPTAADIRDGTITLANDQSSEDAMLFLANLDDRSYERGSYFNITLVDESESVFTDTRLPSSLERGGFTRAGFAISLQPLSGPDTLFDGVFGEIDTISVTAVPGGSVTDAPEPGSLALMACGGVGLLAVARRRSPAPRR